MPALLIADRSPYAERVRHLPPPLEGDDAELARRISATMNSLRGVMPLFGLASICV
jgi:hypothetical protein